MNLQLPSVPLTPKLPAPPRLLEAVRTALGYGSPPLSHTWAQSPEQVTETKERSSECTLVPSQREGVTVRRIGLDLPVFPEITAFKVNLSDPPDLRWCQPICSSSLGGNLNI